MRLRSRLGWLGAWGAAGRQHRWCGCSHSGGLVVVSGGGDARLRRDPLLKLLILLKFCPEPLNLSNFSNFSRAPCSSLSGPGSGIIGLFLR